MSRYSLNPDRLFDRPWRPGHPFHPKTGRVRRIGMGVLFVFLTGVIWGYGYITDSKRVRGMAENYLSGLIGGRVTVGSATLSVFEGLRLDDVRVYVDLDDDPALPPRPDGLVFSARTFIVQYNPRTMVSGQLEAQQIVAEKPQVHLTHDAITNRWNFNRLGQTSRPQPQAVPGPPPEPPKLPELLLRNARVEINELQQGKRVRLGYMALDGHLNPLAADGGRRDDYGFSLQSRGITDDLGPSVNGKFNLATGGVTAKLDFFELGTDVFKMLPDKILPEEVNRLITRLDLKGRIDIPAMSYSPPATQQAEPEFSVEMELRDVSFSIPPNQWASSTDSRRRADALGAADMMTRAYVGGGFATHPSTQPANPAEIGTTPSLEAGVPKAMSWLTAEASAPPIEFRSVNGRFVFTHRGIEVKALQGNVEGNALTIQGSIKGYGPDAPLDIHLGTAKELTVPAIPRYLQSLPPPVREIYEKTLPQGTCKLALDLVRSNEAGPIVASGAVELINAQFLFDDFKYPVRETHGRVEFGRDDHGHDWLALKGIQGRGVAEGPNRDRFISVNGYLGPLNVPGKEPGGLLNIDGFDVASERALFQAFDNDVREALAIFDAPGKGQFPTFRGDVHCEVFKAFGDEGPLRVRLVDLNLKSASARMVGFPYPLQNVSGHVQIHDGYADIEHLDLHVPGGSGKITGRVAWEIPDRKLPDEVAKRKTDLLIDVAGMKVDEDLLSALPADAAGWIRKMDVRGKLDAKGRLTGGEGGKPIGNDPDLPLMFDLDLALHDATVHPRDTSFEVAGATGRLHLVPGRLDLLDLRGTHADAELSLVGQVKWAQKQTTVALVGKGDKVILDDDLLSLIPPAAKSAWAEVQPRGTVDAEITFAGQSSDSGGTSKPTVETPDVTVVDLTRPATLQSTRPTALVLELPASPGRPAIRREIADGLNGTIRPRSLAITLKSLPYELREVTGEVWFSPDRVELRRIGARHGQAELGISGIGRVADTSQWDLAVSAKKVTIDDELMQSLPETLRKGIAAIHANGTIGLDLEHLIYRGGAGGEVDGKPREPELDIQGKLILENVGLDAGVTVKEARGQIPLSASIRSGNLLTLTGSLDIASLNLAGRSVTDLRGEIGKTADRRDVVCSKLRASVGGGDLAGNITLVPADTAPATYKLSLFLRNADVRDLTLETKEGLNGRATASLDIEGSWGQSSIRRGRGDVSIAGHEMARLPLLLGLMQVTNLSLPISSPLSQATARYSLDGETVSFERIELRSDNMLMSGSGKLDFGTRQVQMVFVTDNPGAFKIPFLGDLWRGAQQELVHIQVRGTVQDPKVENRPLGTFTTTVDQVFRGDAPKKKK